MKNFYDGTKLLSLKDINGKKPEIYICTTNRSGGKTTYFNRLLINRFLKSGKKFILLYRYSYELEGCADKFFKEINTLFFKGMTLKSSPKAKGVYHELYLDDNLCGYATDLNHSDTIKKFSHLLSDVNSILFDEFQTENEKYLHNEVSKLISLHTSVARGGGKQYRPVEVFLVSNNISLLNPYYSSLGISSRLSLSTNFLRGDGWVMEQGFVKNASLVQKEGAFNRAFANDKYAQFSSQKIYLNDETAFISTPHGVNTYICTIKYKNKSFGVREYTNDGIIYVSDSFDKTNTLKISVTTEDHDINYLMLKNNHFLIIQLRFFFEHGSFRFKNMECKEALMTLLSF